MPNEETADERTRKLRVEYWTKRLEQTFTHTLSATKLIYTVEGAVLALGAYVLQTLGFSRSSVGFAVVPIALLAVLNLLHARFVTLQHSWYKAIDQELVALLGVTPAVHSERRETLASTHQVHRWMHLVIGGFLLVVAFLMVLYGCFGVFSELPAPASKQLEP